MKTLWAVGVCGVLALGSAAVTLEGCISDGASGGGSASSERVGVTRAALDSDGGAASFPGQVIQALCTRLATCCEGTDTSAFNMSQCIEDFESAGGFNGDGLYLAVPALDTDGGAQVTFNQTSATTCLNDIAAMGCGSDQDTAWQQTTSDCFGALTGLIPVGGTYCHGSIECESGSYCDVSTGTCEPILALGSACTSNDQCEYRGTVNITAFCDVGYPTPSSGSQTCVSATAVGGACGLTYYYEQECQTFVCNPDTALCDTAQLFSDPGTAGGLCASLTLSDAGTPEDGGTCSCTGLNNLGQSVTVNTCGGTVCGQDDATWVCTGSGFVYQGDACSSDGGSEAGSGDGSCSCTGVDYQGDTVTVNTCGQNICGQDDATWVCTASGFVYQGNGCQDGGSGGTCSCTGTNNLGQSVTVNTCGGTVCGQDDATWICTASGFVYQGDACSDAGSGGSDAGSCSCTGTNNLGQSVTVNTCGGTVCGQDDLTWVCTSSGFVFQGDACSDAGSGGVDSSCSCTGINNQGQTVTVNGCGQTVCGQDDLTWSCTGSGFVFQGDPCSDAGSGGSDAGSCSCTGINNQGQSVTVNTCGGTVCGQDDLTWSCTASGFVFQGDACTDAGSGGGGDGSCSCTGINFQGQTVTVDSCGATVCGQDDATWICTASGFAYQGDACTDGG